MDRFSVVLDMMVYCESSYPSLFICLLAPAAEKYETLILFNANRRLWDTSTGQCLKSLVDESNPPASHAIFTPNSRYILVSSLDSTIRLWDYHAAVCMKTYTGHKNVKYVVLLETKDLSKWQANGEPSLIS